MRHRTRSLSRPHLCVALLAVSAAALLTKPACGLDLSVAAIRGDASRTLLGDGSNVVVGIVDSGVDKNHPALAGVNSLGLDRVVAEANFVPTEPTNTGDDFARHGTATAGIVLGNDPAGVYDGLATDARYINARVSDVLNGFASTRWLEDGVGFAIDNGAHVISLPLNTFDTFNQGTLDLDQMLDWAAEHRGVVSAVSSGNIVQAKDGNLHTRSPGGAFNVVTVGWTDVDFDQVHPISSMGPTDDGRVKPEVVGPGASIMTANAAWELQGDWLSGDGCSLATAHVAGMLAQQIDYGITHGLSTSPLVTKATLVNSVDKSVLDKNGDAWAPAASADVTGVFTVSSPLNTHSGAGQIDGALLTQQYAAGEQADGVVATIGWDLASVGNGQTVDYQIGDELLAGSTMTATLTWFRHMGRTDDGDGLINAGDTFSLAEPLDNLDLLVFRDDTLIAESSSSVDNLEHLHLTIDQQANYTIRVVGSSVVGGSGAEQFAVAWRAVQVPEPSAMMYMCLALLASLAAGSLSSERARRAADAV